MASVEQVHQKPHQDAESASAEYLHGGVTDVFLEDIAVKIKDVADQELVQYPGLLPGLQPDAHGVVHDDDGEEEADRELEAASSVAEERGRGQGGYGGQGGYSGQNQQPYQRNYQNYGNYYGRPTRYTGGDGCGTGNLCCDLWCADTMCECMGGDLCGCM